MADLLSGISDTLMDGIQAILYATIYKLLYYLAVGCCWIVNLLYSMFEIMAGLSKVSYDGDYDFLINIFFSNSTVSKVYWSMALIGLTVGFAFAIAAVIKKLFDLSEKEKRSYGQILRGLFKSALTIICMSLIMSMVLNATTLLMQQVNYVFINADDLGEEQAITYTDEEYAAMTRVLSTVGNFSLNPSYNNRYNLNKCFNEIRLDLQYLKANGVFDFHYVSKDMNGNTIATWQSALQKIANSASLERDLSMDVYHESVSNAILDTMELLKVNGSFKPLENYQRNYQPSRSSVPMDRLLFLMASMRAAKNEDYNIAPSLTDPLRGAYYYGEKSIYDLDVVNEDFDIGIAALDYVVLFLTCVKMLEILATIILNCVGRIFNMLLLYLISPMIAAVSPLDDGAKFKQWTTAFIVQSLSVFGTVISMRVLLLFMPIVTDSKLVLFENPIGNLLTKLVIILGAFEVAEKATNLITGILADNAGWQSITAGDMSGAAKSAVAWGKQKAMGVAGTGLSVAKGAAGLGLSGVGMAAKVGLKGAAGVGLAAGYGTYLAGKYAGKGAVAAGKVAGRGIAAGGRAIANKISAWRNSGKNGGGGTGSGGTGSGGGTGSEGQSAPTGNTEQPPGDLPGSNRNPNLNGTNNTDLTDQQTTDSLAQNDGNNPTTENVIPQDERNINPEQNGGNNPNAHNTGNLNQQIGQNPPNIAGGTGNNDGTGSNVPQAARNNNSAQNVGNNPNALNTGNVNQQNGQNPPNITGNTGNNDGTGSNVPQAARNNNPAQNVGNNPNALNTGNVNQQIGQNPPDITGNTGNNGGTGNNVPQAARINNPEQNGGNNPNALNTVNANQQIGQNPPNIAGGAGNNGGTGRNVPQAVRNNNPAQNVGNNPNALNTGNVNQQIGQNPPNIAGGTGNNGGTGSNVPQPERNVNSAPANPGINTNAVNTGNVGQQPGQNPPNIAGNTGNNGGAGNNNNQVEKSSRIAAMAEAFATHSMNPQQNIDPYAAGEQVRINNPRPAKAPPTSVRRQINNTQNT